MAEQPVAATGYRLQQGSIRAECLANSRYVYLKGVVADEAVGPDAAHQIRLRNDDSRCLDESLQDVECPAPYGHHLSIHTQLTVTEINLKSTRPTLRIVRFGQNNSKLRNSKIFSDFLQNGQLQHRGPRAAANGIRGAGLGATCLFRKSQKRERT